MCTRRDVNLGERSAWVSHSAMISAEDIAAKLQEAGFEACAAVKLPMNLQGLKRKLIYVSLF